MKFYREEFRELRKNLRWSIKELSKATNLSRESISKWENGQREPSAKSLYLLANTIGVRVSEISDLEDLYPKSDKKVSETLINDNCNLLDTIKNEGNSYLNNILVNLNNMDSNLKRLSNVLRTILININNIIYIKDTDHKYVLVSKAFLDNSSLDVDYVSKGKTDDDFFPKNEAAFNTKEDEQVFSTGEAIVNLERHIPGSRKKKWGIFNKIPILDNEKKITGVLCVIVDITDRKKEEKYSKTLEYAASKSKTTIWVGRGIDTTGSPYFSKEIIYWRKSENDEFWDELNLSRYSYKDLRNLWYSSISDNDKEIFVGQKKEFKFPLTRFYYVKSMSSEKRVWMRERIFFDSDNELFVGLLTEDSDSQKLNILSNIVNSMTNMIVWSGYYDNNNDFYFSYLSNTEEITGYEPLDFIDKKICVKDLAIEEHRDLFNCLNRDAAYPIYFEFKIIDKRGDEHWLKGNFFKNNADKEIRYDSHFGYYIDISEEKYLEESLKEVKFKELGIKK